MTVNEKLKHIGENFFFKLTGPRLSEAHSDFDWLINRVKLLTEALETISNESDRENGCSAGCWATADQALKND
jgi:hypothetical protein